MSHMYEVPTWLGHGQVHGGGGPGILVLAGFWSLCVFFLVVTHCCEYEDFEDADET